MLRRRIISYANEPFVINSTDNPLIMDLIYRKGWSKNPDGITANECAAVTNEMFGETFSGIYIDGNGLSIPMARESFNGFKYFTGLTEIPEYAFYKNQYITDMVFPPTVTVIRTRAFQNADENPEVLQSLVIPHTVHTIDHGAFLNTKIHSLIIEPGVTSIGFEAFRYAYIGGDLIIPDTVTLIGTNYTNMNCNQFQQLRAEHVRWSANCPIICKYCFVTSYITSIDIPEGVTTICGMAFNGCSNLKSVELPSSVTFIGNRAFYASAGFDYIVLRGTVPPTLEIRSSSQDYQNFHPDKTNQRIYVPDTAVDTYKSATGWSAFADRIKPISEFDE